VRYGKPLAILLLRYSNSNFWFVLENAAFLISIRP